MSPRSGGGRSAGRAGGKAGDRSDGHPFAYGGLDRVIHERARLSVLTSLIAHPKGLPFASLAQLCALTDGNLSRHLRVLEAAKLVQISKGYERNRPRTLCSITAEGRRRYLEYLAVLERVLLDATAAVRSGSGIRGRGDLIGAG